MSDRDGATLSACGRYRYRLWRTLPGSLLTARRRLLFVMLNPSTADAAQDDPTIRRCVGFAKSWGFDVLEVVNLFAWRATDPHALRTVTDPIGPDNDQAIAQAAAAADLIIAAWGVLPRWAADRESTVCRLTASARAPLRILEQTASRFPRHPLYVRGSCQPTVWSV